jgi:acylphosphatase
MSKKGMTTIFRHYLVTGRVQGVGYRRFTERAARAQGLKGATRNLIDGRVEILASGSRAGLENFESEISRGPAGASVSHLEKQDVTADKWPIGPQEFNFIVHKDGERPWL